MSRAVDRADLEELARRVDGVVGDPASAVAAEAARVFSPPARERRAAVSVRVAHHDDVGFALCRSDDSLAYQSMIIGD